MSDIEPSEIPRRRPRPPVRLFGKLEDVVLLGKNKARQQFLIEKIDANIFEFTIANYDGEHLDDLGTGSDESLIKRTEYVLTLSKIALCDLYEKIKEVLED